MHMLMGETDFLLKIVAHDWDDFQRFLTSRLTPRPMSAMLRRRCPSARQRRFPAFPLTAWTSGSLGLLLQLLAKFIDAWHLIIGKGVDRPMAIGEENRQII